MMAGLHYFNTNRSHTSSVRELSKQKHIVKLILREKGFPEKEICKMVKLNKRKPKQKEKRKYIGSTVFDNIN